MNGLTKIDDKTETYIGLTKLDLEKYSDFLTQKYNLKLKEIDSKYIGGCILENGPQGNCYWQYFIKQNWWKIER